MTKITKHRDKILDALRQWFRVHKEAPTMGELCKELGMKSNNRGTLQKWLKTMRGIDIEWEDNVPRTLRLLEKDPLEIESEISTAETLRYVTTGLIEWEKQQPDKRDNIPESLRIGMSQMYLQSLMANDESVAQNIPEFLEQANKPLVDWKPASDIQNLSPEITLIEDGFTSEFTRQWQVEGAEVTKQVQEQVLKDVVHYCRGLGFAEEYRTFRQLVIEKPVLEYSEYRHMLSSSELRPLRDFLVKSYIDLDKFEEHDIYHFCPRCEYLQRKRPHNIYECRHEFCNFLSVKLNLAPKPTIPKDKADRYKIVTPGIHEFVTVPGISELYLAAEFRKLGLKVTLWPEIDEYDLLVEFDKKKRWAIDVKDWAHLYEDSLSKVNCRFDAMETFVVFPDEREERLRIKVIREQKEKELKGVKLRLISEILAEVKDILNK